MELDELLKQAEAGDVEAQCSLIEKYLGEDDYTECTKWLDKAIAQNSAKAQYLKGVYFEYRYAANEKNSEAVEWYEKAIKNGYKDAIHSLAAYYQFGREEKDIGKAIETYLIGALKGYPDCQGELAQLYEEAGNKVEALKWLKTAAENNDAHSQYSLGHNYKNGAGVEQNRKLAIEWFLKAANNGSVFAMEEVGDSYYYAHLSLNNKTDYKEAAKWFIKALDECDKKPDFYNFLILYLLEKILNCKYYGAKIDKQKADEYLTRYNNIKLEKKQKKLAEKQKKKEEKLAEKIKKKEEKKANMRYKK